ncbi:NADH-quinone oxidoreductase subunit C [Paenibacillus sp. MER TA 81-3]|uniref:NADH-quinone oxidoreductase subunit C n=1 Tax=Paenibacillus sp. MER TA 81-3 TaxID=2939573 RepID=UPI00203E2A55|nr:NADH-quinone oxidoreductase subunit C [Paenibacillus sp. MER TA 81-3]MCM3338689.1 NADH-quinone oxidoreductase subunit C [Paenibacillus sp. MER TA 81-3]
MSEEQKDKETKLERTNDVSEPQSEESVKPDTEVPTDTAAAAEAGTSPTADAPASTGADKPKRAPLTEEEKAARVQAAAEARAARAKAAAERVEGSAEAPADKPARARDKAEGTAAGEEKPERPARAPRAKANEEPPKPKEPSPKQPLLDRLVAMLKADVAEDAVEDAVINYENDHLPTVTIKNEHWLSCAHQLRGHLEWSCEYLRNLSGVDQETHLEVVYHMINLSTKAEVAVHVKVDREAPTVASVTPIWPTADWNEREAYDLLGIQFTGHPDLRRIMMPDDWVGHPLRKDYESLDSEV